MKIKINQYIKDKANTINFIENDDKMVKNNLLVVKSLK
jgi:hypothetical protein